MNSSDKLRLKVDNLAAVLSDTEREIVFLINGLDDGERKDFSDVASLLGLESTAVEAIHQAAMEKLRKAY